MFQKGLAFRASRRVGGTGRGQSSNLLERTEKIRLLKDLTRPLAVQVSLFRNFPSSTHLLER